MAKDSDGTGWARPTHMTALNKLTTKIYADGADKAALAEILRSWGLLPSRAAAE